MSLFSVCTLVMLLLRLADPILAANEDKKCDNFYGNPDHASCDALMESLRSGWPGRGKRPKDPDISRVFKINGQPAPAWSTKKERDAASWIPKILKDTPSPCKIALLPIHEINGKMSVSADVSSWPWISASGRDLVQHCLATPEAKGGIILTGERERLVMAIFAANSPFDKQIDEILIAHQTVCARGTQGMVTQAQQIDGAIACALEVPNPFNVTFTPGSLSEPSSHKVNNTR